MVAGVARWGSERWGRRWLYSSMKASSWVCSSAMVAARGWLVSHFLSVWWKRSTFPQVVGWLGVELIWVTPRRCSSASKPLRPPLPPASRVVKTMPLSVSVEYGMPWVARALREFGDDDGAGDAVVGGDRDRVAGVVVEPAEDFDVGAVGEPPVGEVGLPAFVGLFGGEADVGRFGPFLWCWVRPGRPRRRWRLIEAARHLQLVVVFQVPGDGVRVRRRGLCRPVRGAGR